jgi:hypothetical protein
MEPGRDSWSSPQARQPPIITTSCRSRNATRNTDAELRRAILQVIPPTLAETGIDTLIRLALAACASPDISEIRKPDFIGIKRTYGLKKPCRKPRIAYEVGLNCHA